MMAIKSKINTATLKVNKNTPSPTKQYKTTRT